MKVFQKRKGRTLVCLLLALVCLAAGLYLQLSHGDANAELNVLQAQLKEYDAAQEQMQKLTERFEKRVGQLEEANAALAASPEDAKLLSKQERAQGEYDKALKNYNKQLAVIEAMDTREEIIHAMSDLKQESASFNLVCSVLYIAAAMGLCIMIVFLRGGFGKRSIAGLALLLLGLGLVVAGKYQRDLLPSEVDALLPGTRLMAAGIVTTGTGLAVWLLGAFHAERKGKNVIGTLLVLTAAVLLSVGMVTDALPGASARYINYMSPGFPWVFAGGLTLLAGIVLIALGFENIRYDLRKNPLLVLMVLPAIVYFVLNAYIPMVGVYLAFTEYKFGNDFFSTLFGSRFVGLANFEYIFSSGLAWKMTFNTIVYNVIFIGLGTVLKVGVAIMFSEMSGNLYKKSVQTITFLPHFISWVMVGTFAYSLLNYDTGLINGLITSLGFEKVNFYNRPGAWYAIIPAFEFWKSVGYGCIIYVSAITGISNDLYEAADLDGASYMQEVWHITLPCLRPTIVILTLMSLGSIMRGNFDLFYQLVGRSGQLKNTTEIIDTYVWRALREDLQIGMGSASGLYQSVVGMALVVTVNGIVKKIEPDYAIF